MSVKLKNGVNEFHIVPYKEKYGTLVRKIGNDGFGSGYLSEEKLRSLVQRRNTFCVGLMNGEPIGYCFQVEETVEEASELLKVSIDEIKRRNGGEDPVCLFKSMAIDDRYQRRGLAEQMFEYCYRACVADGYHSAWGSAWKVGDTVPMQKIFDRHAFDAIAEIPNIWYDDEQYHCVICGGRCRCTGVIFVKSF